MTTERHADDVIVQTEEAPSTEELLEQLRRERADFLNYKRRVEQDRSSQHDAGRADVLTALLPLLDELERAVARVPDHLKSEPWVQGVALLHNQIEEALDDLGISRIGLKGEPFDPERHEALFFDLRPDITEQYVENVLKPGYRLGERLLRPAQVSVVGPANKPASPDGGQTEHQ